MSGLVPSSAAPGSSADGTPGAPIRSSRRTTWPVRGVFCPRAGKVAKGAATRNVTRNVTSGARTAATRPNIGAGISVFIRGTHYSRHSFRQQVETYRRVQNLLRSRVEGAVRWAEWRRSHTDGQKHRKFNTSTGGKLPANLDFLFCSRLYFEHTTTSNGVRNSSAGSSGIHQVARSGDGPPPEKARGYTEGLHGPREQAP